MRFRLSLLGVHLVLLVGGGIMAFPFYWMLATSFKSPQEALQAQPVWVPERIKPANWFKAARLGDSPLWGGLGPGRSAELFFPGPEGLPPRALVPRSPGAFFDPVADGTKVEVARGEGGWWVRLTNTGEAGFRRVPLVVLWPKGVPLEPPLPPDALRSQGEYWRLEWVNAVPGALGYVFHNYLEAWDAAPWGRYFFVSFFTASVQVAVGLFLAALAAFALARIPFPGKEAVFVLILATMMVPGRSSSSPTTSSSPGWAGWTPTTPSSSPGSPRSSASFSCGSSTSPFPRTSLTPPGLTGPATSPSFSASPCP
ncbi:sugar ABC transporter permease [Thermus thermophilus]|nr:sugar ABC transporter permease [Thermus thermophilus]